MSATAPSFWPYAAAAVIFVSLGGITLILAAAAWAKFEGWLRRNEPHPSNVVSFPRREAVVIQLPKRGESA